MVLDIYLGCCSLGTASFFFYSSSLPDFSLILWASHSSSKSQEAFSLKRANTILCWVKTETLTVTGLKGLWGFWTENEVVKDELLSLEWCLNPLFLSHSTPKTSANPAISDFRRDSSSLQLQMFLRGFMYIIQTSVLASALFNCPVRNTQVSAGLAPHHLVKPSMTLD